MNKDIFDNNSNLFTVPDGYFDFLQERIMNNVQSEKDRLKSQARIIPFRMLIAVAACLLLIFTAGTALFLTHSNKQLAVAETVIDDDFYRWLFISDMISLLAESLDITMPENFMDNYTDFCEEEEAIIRFFERDNVNLIAMLNYMDNEIFFMP